MPKTEYPINRINRPRVEASRTYTRYSRLYDLIGGQFERTYAKLGVYLLEVVPGERVLEIGYGTGHMVVALAKQVGSKGEVYGIDIAPGMYQVTRNRVQKSGLASRVTLLCADAMEIPLEKSIFDAIFMAFTLELFDTPEIPRLLAKCWSVLKPGGRIGVVALSKCQGPTTMIRVYEWINRWFPQWVDCRPIYCKDALKESGFAIQKNRILTMFGLPVELVIGKKL